MHLFSHIIYQIHYQIDTLCAPFFTTKFINIAHLFHLDIHKHSSPHFRVVIPRCDFQMVQIFPNFCPPDFKDDYISRCDFKILWTNFLSWFTQFCIYWCFVLLFLDLVYKETNINGVYSFIEAREVHRFLQLPAGHFPHPGRGCLEHLHAQRLPMVRPYR